VCLGASLPPGAVQAICEAIGRSEDAVKVLAAVGGVESAEASFSMWDMSRIVKRSPALTAAFDAGVDGLVDRLDASDADAAEYLALGQQMIDHGHRPNERYSAPIRDHSGILG
jgi:pyruvate,water dikinase